MILTLMVNISQRLLTNFQTKTSNGYELRISLGHDFQHWLYPIKHRTSHCSFGINTKHCILQSHGIKLPINTFKFTQPVKESQFYSVYWEYFRKLKILNGNLAISPYVQFSSCAVAVHATLMHEKCSRSSSSPLCLLRTVFLSQTYLFRVNPKESKLIQLINHCFGSFQIASPVGGLAPGTAS